MIITVNLFVNTSSGEIAVIISTFIIIIAFYRGIKNSNIRITGESKTMVDICIFNGSEDTTLIAITTIDSACVRIIAINR